MRRQRTGTTTADGGLPPRHVRRRRGRRAVQVLGLVVAGCVASGGAATWATVLTWHGNVSSVGPMDELVVAADDGAGEPRAPSDGFAGRPIRLLVIGSDDRSGENGEIGGRVDGMRADVTMIAQVAADRSRLDVVSLPRDSRVEIPACHLDRDPDGPTSTPVVDKLNEGFATGGLGGDVVPAAACAVSTVQHATGLRFDGVVLIDFAGFEHMVDAVGGVEVCVSEPLVDYAGRTDLDLEPGSHELDGPEALDFARARYVTGSDGTDIARIDRQQQLLGALVDEVTSAEVLANPVSVARFVDALTSSLTVSDELASPRTLTGLAWSVRDLRPADVAFLTVPWEYSADGDVLWTGAADVVWDRLARDVPIDGSRPVRAEATAGPEGGNPADGGTADEDPTSGDDGESEGGPELAVRSGAQVDGAGCG